MSNATLLSRREGTVNYIKLENITDFDVRKTFDCGQCFRFEPVSPSAHAVEYGGVVNGRYVTVGQDAPDALVIHNVSEADLPFLLRYLSLDVD